MSRFSFTLLTALFAVHALFAQVAKDEAVALTAQVSLSPLAVNLSWPTPTSPSSIQLMRRKKGDSGLLWSTLANYANSTANSYLDDNIIQGNAYEYAVKIVSNNIEARGYALTAVLTPLVHQRGKILVFIDSTTADAVGLELKVFKDAMRGDGWQPMPFKTGPSSTIQSIKNQIIAAYNADPSNIKAILLIGDVPVPYSGNAAWDGHPDHNGAWPSDAYYADINGIWTDQSINNTSASRPINQNIPGDGKFDQSIMPSAAELMIGRIDFRHLDPAVFGATPIELMKRYLLKNARWRTQQYRVSERALVDDNFGYFGGEAFAANGFRNAYPMVGSDNVVEGDFLTEPGSFLMGYGTGAGSYTSASGVGTSTDFAQDSINIVFANIFGSYHGDWDYDNNPLMPAALASKGGILTCSWAGRPNHLLHGLAAGETIGFCMKETMNAQFNNQYLFSSEVGRSGAHIALLGDPTLRAKMLAPPTALSVTANCSNVRLQWQPSPDTAILGYHVYRAFGLDGPYNLAATNLINGNEWIDPAPPSDTLYYQVRAVRIDQTPGGGIFYNNSIGPIERVIFQAQPSPNVWIPPVHLNACVTPTGFLVALVENAAAYAPLTYNWIGPNGPISTNNDSIQIEASGLYWVTVTSANGCTSTAQTAVLQSPPVNYNFLPRTITCAAPSASITFPSGYNYMYTVNGQTYLAGDTFTVSSPGVYTIDYGIPGTPCEFTTQWVVTQDLLAPAVDISAPTTVLNCQTAAIPLTVTAAGSNFTYTWLSPTSPVDPFNPVAVEPGTYCVVVTNVDNGCSATDCIIITQDTVSIQGSGVVTNASGTGTNDGAITFTPSTPSIYSFLWNTGATTATITGLAPGVYVVTVTNELTDCSSSFSFEVTEPSSAQTLPDGWVLHLAPNPVHTHLRLWGSSTQPHAVLGAVYNAQGVSMNALSPQPGAQFDWEIETSLWPSGPYWLTLRLDNGHTITRQIIVAH